jgi:protocatechuate 3,4-dioxygenase, beta subunit
MDTSETNKKNNPFNAITRRRLLQIGAGTLGLLATSGISLAELCPVVTTPRQTRGPFFPYDNVVSFPIREGEDQSLPLILANDNDLTFVKGKSGKAQGQIIYFQGQVLKNSSADSKVCQPIAGATLLMWQANFSGRYNHKGDDSAPQQFPHPKTGKVMERVHDEHFQYWGKAVTDQHGYFLFKTVLPSFYPATDDLYRPPHLHFSIRAQGRPEFITQTYFKGDALPNSGIIHDLNAKDWILRNPKLSPAQQKHVIVEFQPDSTGKLTDGLLGTCQILLPS